MTRMDYKLLRIQKEIKQYIVAQHLGCSNTLVCRYEKGKESMSASKVNMYQNFIENYVIN